MTVEEQVRHYIDEKLLVGGSRDYKDEASFLQTGIVDSLGILDLVSFVEERFGIEVDDDEVVPDNFDSVQQLSSYVRRKQGTS